MSEKKTTERPYIITITGTKGKTTISRLLNHVFNKRKLPTLLVDTEGWYLNNKKLGTKTDSSRLWGMTSTISPGRFLYLLKNKVNSIAVLEASVSCSGVRGLGYLRHNIGIFSNIYADHIGYRIKSRKQLAQEKSKYIFKQIKLNGTAVFNADDKYICDNLNFVPKKRNVTLIPVGFNFKFFNIKNHIKKGGTAVTFDKGYIGFLNKKGFKKVLKVKDINLTFEGHYKPSIYNLMLVVGALFAENSFKSIDKETIDNILSYHLDEYGGRLTLLKHKRKNIRVLIDYAHEKESFKQVALLARKLTDEKTIGIIRIAPDRKNSVIRETGKYIANLFDNVVVYDKVDGINRIQYKNLNKSLDRKIGDVSQIFYEAIKKETKNSAGVYRKIKEADAVKFAFAKACPGDIIVHICNDDLKKSVKLIKKYMK